MRYNFFRLMFVGLFWVIINWQFSQSQMVSVPAGSFTMGNNHSKEDQKPEHKVTISAFKMDKHEVTEAQYDSCVKTGKCTPAHYTDGHCVIWASNGFRGVKVPADRRNPQFPVVCVSWFQAQAYCQAHGKKLPHEAQWEYAASGGKRSTYAWGDQSPKSNCVLASNQKPDKVCSYKPNQFGLFDMTGNAWEWTNDFYSKDYYSYSASKDPNGPEVGLYKVIRGGGWYSSADQLTVTNRYWFSPDYAEVSIGFRCVGN